MQKLKTLVSIATQFLNFTASGYGLSKCERVNNGQRSNSASHAMYAIRRTLLPISLCVCASIAQAQWEVGPNLGAAIPVTGYGEVVKPGYLIGMAGNTD